jgi:LmbE family N-acetylglucosaminyl deacetylase
MTPSHLSDERSGFQMRMLVVAAHPDDEVLGCGGYMARFSRHNEVFTVIVTEGSSSQYSAQDYKEIIAQKKKAAVAANGILGVKEVIFGDYPDMKLENIDHIELNSFLERVISDIRPDILLTHHLYDMNADHRQIFESVAIASRPIKKLPLKVLLFETPSSTEWQSYDLRQIFVPNVYIDIAGTIGQKIEAFKCYKTEVREYPHPRSEGGIRTYAAFRGLASGLTAAEAFSLYRCVETEF